MAVKTKAEAVVAPRLNLSESHLVSWLALANGDTGDPMEVPECSDKTVQIGKTGDTFGAGTVAIEGSNDGATWFALRSPLGTALSGIAANAIHAILENPRFIRPNLSGGAGGSMDIFIMAHRGRGRAL